VRTVPGALLALSSSYDKTVAAWRVGGGSKGGRGGQAAAGPPCGVLGGLGAPLLELEVAGSSAAAGAACGAKKAWRVGWGRGQVAEQGVNRQPAAAAGT
jgi:hypothetical protein